MGLLETRAVVGVTSPPPPTLIIPVLDDRLFDIIRANPGNPPTFFTGLGMDPAEITSALARLSARRVIRITGGNITPR